jgi:SAM-dependent methyltransferase
MPNPRVYTEELLDGPDQDPAELASSLEQVAQVNRLFGGTRALRWHLSRLGASDDLRVLDVGTGNGRLVTELIRWARRSGGRWRVTGVDVHPAVIDVARELASPDSIALVQADALSLPFGDASFDVVCCTLTLHHFDEADAVALVREMGRVARRAVLVNDLERHMLNYLSARVLALTLWRGNRLTRHDGPLSVLRSFTADELHAIGRRAGLQGARVRKHFPFRLVLEGRPGSPGQGGPA